MTPPAPPLTSMLSGLVQSASSIFSSDNLQSHPGSSARTARNVVLFVHGFLGSEESFFQFPRHLEARLHELHGFESHTFPAYDCKHSIQVAATRVAQYLRSLVPVVDETDVDVGNPAARLNVVLIAHSMGGLVVADAVRMLYDEDDGVEGSFSTSFAIKTVASTDLVSFRQQPHPPRPRPASQHPINVLGVLAFDSPYFHLHPDMLNLAHRPLANVVDIVLNGGSLWTKLAALAVPAAIGAAMARYLPEYIEFLAPLFAESLTRRVARVQYLLDRGIRFACFYPKLAQSNPKPWTFIYLPTALPPHISALFHPIPTNLTNPLEAHTHIFDAQLNSIPYGRLVADVVELIHSWHLTDDPAVAASLTDSDLPPCEDDLD
ncbi:hypothetical protein BCR44DRAFT_1431309 [Catenaria anguillulae PL171]|uniref:DUF676 domain-containing protein n=1 Tax=Catenaria anguillulae PL171 TaxID=765915 RepID=A0A1Y2HR04_9FUNG|nr:hypothetical protein BCR44DRAFT_1431309 [Catenaria anguillulae PL171]